MEEVVLGLPLGDRTVGVKRSAAGHLVFGGGVEHRGGVVLTDFRPHSNAVAGRTVVAGLLAPGAAAVVVIDDLGDAYRATVDAGVWVAVAGEAGFSEPLVRFEDAAGAIVVPPLPDGPRQPVPDADEPCPVCAAVAWLEIGGEPRCERCGVHVNEGMLSDLSPDEDVDVEDDDFDDDEPSSPAFPVYAAAGLRASAGGWQSDGSRMTEVAVEQEGLTIVSADRGRGGWGPRGRLAAMLLDHTWDAKRSEAAMMIRLAAAARAARRRAVAAVLEQRTFVIDGRAEPFRFIASGNVWVAVRDHHGTRVMIAAREADPASVVLERLLDPGDPAAGTTPEPAASVTSRRRAAAGELLSRGQVAALIDECGFGEHRDAILDEVRAGYRLEPDTDGPHRVGGLPDLADGEVWPRGEDGVPHTLVAQIDCAQLPPLISMFTGPDWPHGGALLRIFAALDGRDPEPGPALALACPAGTPVTRAALPPRPEPTSEYYDDSLRVLHETRVRAVPFLTAPVGAYVLPEGAYWENVNEYWRFTQRLMAGGERPLQRTRGMVHLLGHAETVQGEDPRYVGPGIYRDDPALDAMDAWRVLINIDDGYRGMSFGDGGALAIVGPVADLAAGRYDRLVTEPSLG